MRFTARGIRIIAALVVAILLSAVFRDLIMALIPSLILLVLVFDLAFLVRDLRELRRASVTPRELEIRMIAGELREEELVIRTRLAERIDLRPPWEWAKVRKHPARETCRFEITFSPKVYGEYVATSIEIAIRSMLGAVEGGAYLPIGVKAKVYPKTLPLIARAIELLVAGGFYGAGTIPGRRKGYGFEYIGTREYVAGDPLKLIDWKATARFLKLMVKEYLEETYGSAYIVHDVRSSGPATRDELSSMFLSAILGAVSAGVPISLAIKSGHELIFEGLRMAARDALKVAVAHVMRELGIFEWDVYELVSPKPTRRLVDVVKRARLEGLAKILEYKRRTRVPMRLIDAPQTGANVTYIGSILHDSESIVELADDCRMKGRALTVYTPSKPWIDARSLEEAYVMYRSYFRILSAIRELTARIKIGIGARDIELGHYGS